MTASSVLAAPWATVDDLPTGAVAPVAPATWADVLGAASETLFLLTGQQWRGTSQSRVQVLRAGYNGSSSPLPGWVPLPVVLPSPGWDGWSGWLRQVVVVALPSSPVTSIDEVTIDGDVLDPSLYWCSSAGLLERTDGQPWPVDGSLLVTYTSGVAPPVQGKLAAIALAIEIAKASPGGTGSRLQNLVTQTTREGVTVAAVNLRDALTGGYTGLPDVDLFISTWNPQKMRRRASVWTPDHGRTRRNPGPAVLPGPSPTYVPTVNLDIYEGDDRSFAFPVRDSNGAPFPLVGYTAKAQVRAAPGGALLHGWSSGNGNVTVGNGQVTLSVSDSETWSFTRGVYDLQLIDGQGRHEVIARGTVRVTAGVTT